MCIRWSCRCWVKRVSNSNLHLRLEQLPLRCQSSVQSSSALRCREIRPSCCVGPRTAEAAAAEGTEFCTRSVPWRRAPRQWRRRKEGFKTPRSRTGGVKRLISPLQTQSPMLDSTNVPSDLLTFSVLGIEKRRIFLFCEHPCTRTSLLSR